MPAVQTGLRRNRVAASSGRCHRREKEEEIGKQVGGHYVWYLWHEEIGKQVLASPSYEVRGEVTGQQIAVPLPMVSVSGRYLLS